MTICKVLAALLALAGTTLPAISQAADDVASLRAELQALKNEYQTRVDALEQRLTQLESAPVAGLSEPKIGRASGRDRVQLGVAAVSYRMKSSCRSTVLR